MPKAPKLNLPEVWEKLRMSLRQGARGGGELRELLQISQPALSLLIKAHKNELFITGKTKSAAYALPREVEGLPRHIQVCAIDPHGKSAKAGILTPVYPAGAFHWEGVEKRDSRFYPGLPYFLEDLRPGGYLGALIPQLHPEIDAPKDVTKWNTEQCLRYLIRFGSDLIGNFILGDEAYSRFLEQRERAPAVKRRDRAAVYEKYASDVIALGDPGSSAAGEQPKFLTTKEPATQVIVKFSPKKEDARARRQADLLWCEGLALGVLHRAGFEVAAWEVVEGPKRSFLEVERFDRTRDQGRRGLVSLRALDLEFAGKGEGWSAVSSVLHQQKVISYSDHEKVRFLDLFGALIANTDRHLGNLSFFAEPDRKFRLAPVYDMLPMHYFPKVEVADRDFKPPQPVPSLAEAWRKALPTAQEFWKQVSKQERITREFRGIARENLKILDGLSSKVAALPS